MGIESEADFENWSQNKAAEDLEDQAPVAFPDAAEDVARAAAEDKMADLGAYVGTLTAEEALGELLHITRKATSLPLEVLVSLAPMLLPVVSVVLERFVTQCPTKATIPEEQTLHSCTLLLRAHVAAVEALAPDGGAGS